MINFKLWKTKRLHRKVIYYEHRISQFQHYLKQIRKWHKLAKKRLQKQLKTLNEHEVVQFGISEGYIETNVEQYKH